jgi:hypothetical protein
MNPDYCNDPRLVIEAMGERYEDTEFIEYAVKGSRKLPEYELADLFMDRTGKLASLAIEFLEERKT